MVSNRPPRGYYERQYPLFHQVEYEFGLSAEEATKDMTMIPFFWNDEAKLNPSQVIVNPRNPSWAISSESNCYKGSIVPEINVFIRANIPKAARVTDDLQFIDFEYMPINVAMLSGLEAEDDKSGTQVEDILTLVHETTDKQATPDWNGFDLFNATVFDADMPGLTGGQTIEGINFDKEVYFDALQWYTNGGMLKKETGRLTRVSLHKERPWYKSVSRFTAPNVKRINPYTFCGILFRVAQAGTKDQVVQASETTAIEHIHFTVDIKFPEWNPAFEQEAP